jgi:hypothetical protein
MEQQAFGILMAAGFVLFAILMVMLEKELPR